VFIKKWREYSKAHKLPNAHNPVTNDPMEATYVGINMWKQAVEKAGTTNVDDVIKAMAGQTFNSPSGYMLKMDSINHHLSKPAMIAAIQKSGQLKVVWQSKGPVHAMPWVEELSPYYWGTKPGEVTVKTDVNSLP
jgi:urea transport system substrate-binding protein